MADPKAVMRAAYAKSGANEREYHAALLGVLSTMLSPAQWAAANAAAARCFRDRQPREDRP